MRVALKSGRCGSALAAGSGRHGCIDGTPRGQRRPVLVVPAMRLGGGVVTMDFGVGMLGALPTTRAGLVMAGLTATGLVAIGLIATGLTVTGLTPTNPVQV